MSQWIEIIGASEHNLQDISLKIPKHQLVVLTGVSGSGKSTLALDIIYKEAKRRYLSMFLSPKQGIFIPPPKVKDIKGLPPVVMLRQMSSPSTPRSTVGTLSEIADWLRLLMTKAGTPYCLKCQRPLHAYCLDEMLLELKNLPENEKLMILAPVNATSPNWHLEWVKRGFVRARIDGAIYDLTEQPPPANLNKAELVIDRLILKKGIENRLLESLELAIKIGHGKVVVWQSAGKESFFSLIPECPQCQEVFPSITPAHFSPNTPVGACAVCKGHGYVQGQICESCQGSGLTSLARQVKLRGKDIVELSNLSVKELFDFMKDLHLPSSKQPLAIPLIKAIIERLKGLLTLKLDYLRLSQSVRDLSSGEYRRLLISRCLNQQLSDVLFIFDEPASGFSETEAQGLLKVFKGLLQNGNSLLIIEHHPKIINQADFLIELGPGAGENGGKVVFTGRPFKQQEAKVKTKAFHQIRSKEEPINWITLSSHHKNLKGQEIKIPIHCLTCLYGPSGSGKTAVIEALAANDGVKGLESFKAIAFIDTQIAFKNKRAIVATYTGLFDPIRRLFAQLPEARARGYSEARFSFNSPEGQCELCHGEGEIVLKEFSEELTTPCELCQGRRFKNAILEIKFKGKSIADVLEMTIWQAVNLFEHIPHIRRRLEALTQLGLGYLVLGQKLKTLSGGELTRLKLARYLNARKNTLYLLDEPTRGLHLKDVRELTTVLKKLISHGHTVVIASNHPFLLQEADFLIELGPEGGPKGGYLLQTQWK